MSNKSTQNDSRINDPDYLTVNAFASLVERERQSISYHLTKGRLKPYANQGDLIFNHDGEWRIHRSLAHQIPQKKHASSPLKNTLKESIIEGEFTSASVEVSPAQPSTNPSSQAMLHFMRETLDRFEQMSSEVTELRVENERYRLLTTGREKNIQDLENEISQRQKLILEKEATIKSFQEQEKAIHQMKDNLSEIQKRVSQATQELQSKDHYIEELKNQLIKKEQSSTSAPKTWLQKLFE